MTSGQTIPLQRSLCRAGSGWGLVVWWCVGWALPVVAAEPPRRLLLIGQGPDGQHAAGTHEYLAGLETLRQSLSPEKSIACRLVNIDQAAGDVPGLLDGCDGAVLFVAEGFRWLAEDGARRAAFERLAARGGGLVGLHWALGCREARFIEPGRSLFGACHGGPDRRYQELDTRLEIVGGGHEVVRGLRSLAVHDEFYFRLKRVDATVGLKPLVTAEIEGMAEMVAWGWERPDGGRSCGFTGLHVHANWQEEFYQQWAVQAVVWTLKLPLAAAGDALRAADR